jgi:succinyl-diaminopimelate desuccinylase
VVGEEVDCAGSRHFLAEGGMEGVGALVIAEPTRLDLVPLHKGAFRVEVVTRGRAAHGAMPETGVNAVLHMLEYLRALPDLDLSGPQHPLLSGVTLSINRIEGGFRTNVVPDECRATIDIRTLPGQDHGSLLVVLESLAARLGEAIDDFSAAVEVIQDVAPVETPLDHELVRAVERAATLASGTPPRIRGVSYFSDASVLQPATGVPTVLFGPGDDAVAHRTDEHVSVSDLVAAARVFAALPVVAFGAAGRAPAEAAGSDGRGAGLP